MAKVDAIRGAPKHIEGMNIDAYKLEESTMSTTLQTGPDNWYGVTDARKRKRIQDRLAQRARSKQMNQLGQVPSF
ncbi:hypothetical protein M8818_000417 [Zalaria obscura]|uniref:Uncharacterized protein n=1 Tax=Zalaria obscura TaxID=2024903 RepID=A0ACC3SNB1_9PEZI